MGNGGLNASDVHVLSELADMLMWAGHDRAADAIYAAVEAEQAASSAADATGWQGVFGS